MGIGTGQGVLCHLVQCQVSLLCVPQLLHVSTELGFLDGETAEFGNHGARLQSHVLGEDPTKQVKGKAPATQHQVVRHVLAQ